MPADLLIMGLNQMFKIVITLLFLERFRPNFRTSFSISKSITHNRIFTVYKNWKKKLSETWQTCPRENGPGGASAQSRNSKIWCNIPNECVRKVKKFQVPILSRFPYRAEKLAGGPIRPPPPPPVIGLRMISKNLPICEIYPNSSENNMPSNQFISTNTAGGHSVSPAHLASLHIQSADTQ